VGSPMNGPHTAQIDAAFLAWMKTLPKGNQVIMWDAIDKGVRSYTREAFYAAYELGYTEGVTAYEGGGIDE